MQQIYNVVIRHPASASCLVVTLVSLFLFATSAPVISASPRTAANQPAYPVYGNGPVEVCLYTDYFCPPCRAIKASVDPLVRKLVELNRIRVVFVDVPLSKQSIEYAKEYLRCLHAYDNNLDTAITLKDHFNYAAENGRSIEAYLDTAGIVRTQERNSCVSTIFSFYNIKIKEDRVRATPTCVIAGENGFKESYTGGKAIVAALQRLL